jgi:hypothetical protein
MMSGNLTICSQDISFIHIQDRVKCVGCAGGYGGAVRERLRRSGKHLFCTRRSLYFVTVVVTKIAAPLVDITVK